MEGIPVKTVTLFLIIVLSMRLNGLGDTKIVTLEPQKIGSSMHTVAANE